MVYEISEKQGEKRKRSITKTCRCAFMMGISKRAHPKNMLCSFRQTAHKKLEFVVFFIPVAEHLQFAAHGFHRTANVYIRSGTYIIIKLVGHRYRSSHEE